MQAEYVCGVDEAVGDWLETKTIDDSTQATLDALEEGVRVAPDRQVAIAQLGARWGVSFESPTPAPPVPAPQSSPHVVQGLVLGAPLVSGGAVSRWPRRRGVLVGVNYFGTRAELRGCINDVHNLRSLLSELGWGASDLVVLTDDRPGSDAPTRANIERALGWLAEDAEPGDALFFHFSGHGAQEEDPNGFEEDGMHETILPVDFEQAGMITDDRISDLVVKPLPEGVRLTAVMDCCHSGTGMDLPFSHTARGWREETNPFHTRADVQLFSGCEDEDTSADATGASGQAGGAMTTAFCDVLRESPRISYPELMASLHSLMRRRGFSQRPQLTSSQAFPFDRGFQLDDAIPNSNEQLGRIFRKKFSPRPRPMSGPLAEMLGMGAAAVGAMAAFDMAAGMAGGFAGLFG